MFHILVMSSLPEDSTALGTEGEGLRPFIDKRSHQIFGAALWQVFELKIALDAARIRLDLLPEVEVIQNLFELRFPVFALDEKGGDAARLLEQSIIPAEKSPALPLSQGQKFRILNLAEVESVKPENLEPLGQFSEHAIDNEFHNKNLCWIIEDKAEHFNRALKI